MLQMNILYIGSSAALSLIPFKKLLSENFTVSAVGVVTPIVFDKKIIALENESLALAANALAIPVIDFSQAAQDIVAQCEEYAIDVILMSCYSRRLPDEVINLVEKRCFNMHPSLLSRFRGPEPVFWQMKSGSDIGVSWHQVIHDFDAGNIVAQKKIFLDDGATHSEIDSQLAETGAELMLKFLSDLAQDNLTPAPQDPGTASYYPYPQKHDFEIDLNYSAQQIYNFMSATQAFSIPFLCRINDRQFYLAEALDYDNNRTLESAEVQSDRLYIPCNGGVLIAAYTDKMST